MAIRFRVVDDAVEVHPSALMEAMASLAVIADPRHHPHHHAFVRGMRLVSPGLRRELRAYRFTFDRIWPFFLVAEQPGAAPDAGAELVRLDALPVGKLATALLRPLYSDQHRGPTDPAWRSEPAADRRAVSVAARRYGPAAEEAARQLVERPEEGVARFRAVLRSYWEDAFRAEWDRVAPMLASASVQIRHDVAANGLLEYLQRFSARLVVDAQQQAFGLDAEHEHQVAVTRHVPLRLVPSIYAWPHVSVNCDDEWQRGLVVPVPHPEATVRAPSAPGRLADRLRALADPGRLELVRLVADRPRSTQELAPLLGLTEQGVSKQLRRLADVGLVTARREGYWVVYALDADAARALGSDLEQYLDLPLVPVERPPRSTGPAATTARGRRQRRP